MTQTRTGPTVQKLADHIQADIADVVEKLEAARALLSVLEGETGFVAGMASVLRSKGLELDKMVGDLDDEAEGARRKLLGTTRPEIVQSMDPDHAKRVTAAKGAG